MLFREWKEERSEAGGDMRHLFGGFGVFFLVFSFEFCFIEDAATSPAAPYPIFNSMRKGKKPHATCLLLLTAPSPAVDAT